MTKIITCQRLHNIHVDYKKHKCVKRNRLSSYWLYGKFYCKTHAAFKALQLACEKGILADSDD
jgi:hypothetical protein